MKARLIKPSKKDDNSYVLAVPLVPEEKESIDLRTTRDGEGTLGVGASAMPDESIYID
jgi:hypothetical protein